MKSLLAGGMLCLFTGPTLFAQNVLPAENVLESPAPKKVRNHSFYFSWGYNTESYTRSNIHVSQPELGREYMLQQVVGNDRRAWDEGLFSIPLTIPQYGYRIGWMFNETKGWGLEINFDHTKYIVKQGQDIRVTGNMGDGRAVDTMIDFREKNGFLYYLNNGANFFLLNAVKRFPVWSNKKGSLRLDALGKAGFGPVVPHVENTFFGDKNKPHFQVGGWNTGIEADLKLTAFKRIYLEGGIKGDYARYSGLRIYKGTVKQAFGSFIFNFSLGVQI